MPPKSTLAKSLNRSSDVLPNAPLRSKDWHANFAIAEGADKKVLAETWLTRFFQHTNGMAADDYCSFTGKLWPRQIEWLAAIVPFVGADYFATQDIAPHARGLYDALWNDHHQDPEIDWLRKLWLSDDTVQLDTILQHAQYMDFELCKEYGNLILALAERALFYTDATNAHHEAVARMSCVVGAAGVKRELGTTQQYASWQDFGYFNRVLPKNKNPDIIDVPSALHIKNEVTGKYESVVLEQLVESLERAVYSHIDGYQYVIKDSLIALACAVDTDIVPYYALATWLPKYQGYWDACNATGMHFQEACMELCTKLSSPAAATENGEAPLAGPQ